MRSNEMQWNVRDGLRSMACLPSFPFTSDTPLIHSLAAKRWLLGVSVRTEHTLRTVQRCQGTKI